MSSDYLLLMGSLSGVTKKIGLGVFQLRSGYDRGGGYFAARLIKYLSLGIFEAHTSV